MPVQRIRHLRLNRRRKQGSRGRKKEQLVNVKNLIQVSVQRRNQIKNINETLSLSLVNIQSFKNKELLVNDFIH